MNDRTIIEDSRGGGKSLWHHSRDGSRLDLKLIIHKIEIFGLRVMIVSFVESCFLQILES